MTTIHYTHNYHYFLTIRRHSMKDYVNPPAIQEVLATMPIYVSMGKYEIAGKQLHWHGWVTSDCSIRYKEHSSISGYRCYWRRITSGQQVIDYINKCTEPQDQVIAENHWTHNYAFDKGNVDTIKT